MKAETKENPWQSTEKKQHLWMASMRVYLHC